MATAEPAGHLVGTGRPQEVAGEGPQLGAVQVGLVVEGQHVPTAGVVHAPAQVADGVCLGLLPGGQVGGEQLDVQAVAGDVHHVVGLQRAGDRCSHVLLEGQVGIAGRHHHRARHRAGRREAQHQATRPVGDAAGLGDRAVRARHDGTSQVDRQVGAGRRRNPHGGRCSQPGPPSGHPVGHRWVVAHPVEHLRVLVGEHQHAGTAGQYLWTLDCVEQALHGAVHDEVGCCQPGDGSPVPAQGHRRTGGTDRDRPGVGRRGHDHRGHRRTEALQGDGRHLDQLRTAVGLGQHHGRLAGGHGATREVVRKGLYPMPRHGHVLLPRTRQSGRRSVVVEPGPAQSAEADLDAPRKHRGTAAGIAVHALQGAGPQ